MVESGSKSSHSRFVVRKVAQDSLQMVRDDRVVSILDFEGPVTRIVAPPLEPEVYELRAELGMVFRPLGKIFKDHPGVELRTPSDPRAVAAYWIHDRDIEEPNSDARFRFRLTGDSHQPTVVALLTGPRLLVLREAWKDSEIEAGIIFYLDVEEEISPEIQIYAAMGLVSVAWNSRPDAQRMGV